ncbi:MAG TPA: hypothetical protein VJG83_03540 [archaeon]|nr:hypothetical protein [archaeon]
MHSTLEAKKLLDRAPKYFTPEQLKEIKKFAIFASILAITPFFMLTIFGLAYALKGFAITFEQSLFVLLAFLAATYLLLPRLASKLTYAIEQNRKNNISQKSRKWENG